MKLNVRKEFKQQKGFEGIMKVTNFTEKSSNQPLETELQTIDNSSFLNNNSIKKENLMDWDFASANTQELTHNIHPYPARMVPQIARRLIESYSEVGDIVLDPFCGSGGVLLEAEISGRKSIGYDINFLANLIAKVKTTSLNIGELNKAKNDLFKKIGEKIAFHEIKSSLYKNNENKKEKLEIKIIEKDILKKWFKNYVFEELEIIRQSIEEFKENENVYNFFKVCFSATIVKVSNVAREDNPYFIRLMKGERLKKFSPKVILTFKEQIEKSIKMMKKLNEKMNRIQNTLAINKVSMDDLKPKVKLHDSRNMNLNNIKLIITSPPYGEERSTMAYTTYSKLPLMCLNFKYEDILNASKKSLGGEIKNKIENLPSQTLKDTIKEIEKLKENGKRAKDVLSFFVDYYLVIKEMFKALREDGRVCIVIGNRTVKKIPILNDRITIELANSIGFKVDNIFYRKLPKKVLSRNDGRTDLINKESIIILKKGDKNE